MKLLVLLLALYAAAAPATGWRPATEAELKDWVPARAPVEKERIETEFPAASGVTNGKAYVFGVVLITAGYSADGKYSHFFASQVPIKVGDLSLKPGNYVFGFQKNLDSDSLSVKFYDAQSGKFLGVVEANRNSRIGRIVQFHIYPPNDRSIVQIGRFAFPYKLGK